MKGYYRIALFLAVFVLIFILSACEHRDPLKPHELSIWPEVLEDIPEEYQDEAKNLIDDLTEQSYNIEIIFQRVIEFQEEE